MHVNVFHLENWNLESENTGHFHMVYQNTETAAMLVFQTNPVGVELCSYVNLFFCSSKICMTAGHVRENALYHKIFKNVSNVSQP